MTITEEQLKLNAEKWEDQVEALARHLAEMKGENPDEISWSTMSVANWQCYVGDAEEYLRRRAMNKHYWEYLCGHRD